MSIENRNELGTIEIDNKVFTDISKMVCEKVEGVFPVKKEEYATCSIKDNDVKLHISIKIKQGLDIVNTCSSIQSEIHEAVLNMTGIDCSNITVDIQGFIVETKS